jgi:hypothetical protein
MGEVILPKTHDLNPATCKISIRMIAESFAQTGERLQCGGDWL